MIIKRFQICFKNLISSVLSRFRITFSNFPESSRNFQKKTQFPSFFYLYPLLLRTFFPEILLIFLVANVLFDYDYDRKSSEQISILSHFYPLCSLLFFFSSANTNVVCIEQGLGTGAGFLVCNFVFKWQVRSANIIG